MFSRVRQEPDDSWPPTPAPLTPSPTPWCCPQRESSVLKVWGETSGPRVEVLSLHQDCPHPNAECPSVTSSSSSWHTWNCLILRCVGAATTEVFKVCPRPSPPGRLLSLQLLWIFIELYIEFSYLYICTKLKKTGPQTGWCHCLIKTPEKSNLVSSGKPHVLCPSKETDVHFLTDN